MRDSEYNAYEALRGAAAVIDAGIMQRYEYRERAERRRLVGAKAIGLIEALIHTGDMPNFAKASAQRLIEEWSR